MTAILIAATLAWFPRATPAAGPGRTLTHPIPAAAAASVSRVLGAQEPRFHIRSDLRARSGSLQEQFDPAGLALSSGRIRLELGLSGWGRPGHLTSTSPATPEHESNRVTYGYRGGAAQQWFANGPLGVEQGFTIAQRPEGAGELQLSLAVSGNVSVAPGSGTGLTFHGPGATTLTYGGLTATDASGHALGATLTPAAGGRIDITVDDRGARYPIAVDPFIQLAKLSDPNLVTLGTAVAIGGSTIVAAAQDNAQADAGPTKVDVFVEPAGGWGSPGALVATLAAGTQADDFAGSLEYGSLAISSDGSTVLAGADATTVGANMAQGVAYVFQRPPGGWSGALGPTATLKNSGGSASDDFGSSVALSADGETAAIGVPQQGGSGNGQVDVFVRSGATWATTGTPTAIFTDNAATSAGGYLGTAVGIGGTFIAATVPNANSTTGQTDIFSEIGGAWHSEQSPDAVLMPVGSTNFDNFGKALGMSSSGDTIAVGANDRNEGAGAVYVYQTSSGWSGHVTQSALLTGPAGTDNGVGTSVAVSGTTVLAGAPGTTNNNEAGSGAGYIYQEPANGWVNTSTPDAIVNPGDSQANAQAGERSALSNGVAVLGSFQTDSGKGALYVFGSDPVTTVSLTPAAPNGTNGWYTVPVTAAVTASDPFSSVTATNCELDPAAPPSTFASIPSGCGFSSAGAAISTSGSHTLYAASENAAGVAGAPLATSVKIDREPPTVKCIGTPSFQLGSSGGLVSASVTDSISGPVAQTVSTQVGAKVFGRKTVALTGTDIAGNRTTTKCPYGVTAPSLNPSPTMNWTFVPGGSSTTVASMSVSSIPGAAAVTVLCHGHGCPFGSHSLKAPKPKQRCTGKGKHRKCHATAPKPYSVSLGGLLRGHRLGVGTKLTVEISEADRIGKAYLFTIVAGRQPPDKIECLAPGSAAPGAGC